MRYSARASLLLGFLRGRRSFPSVGPVVRFLLPALLGFVALAGSAAAAYTPSLTGSVEGFRVAGIEPDGDPIDQVALLIHLAPSGRQPPLHLVVNAYMENFTPDTTPILPDLLHRNQTAQNLGGFLQGKALLVDDAGRVLQIGPFLAEAFFDNSNHGVMQLSGEGKTSLKGIFNLVHTGNTVHITGSFSGHLDLSAAALREVQADRGKPMRPLKGILDTVSVHPAPMLGRATSGTPGAPLHTGYASSSHGRTLSPLTLAAGAGAVLCFLIAGVLYVRGRKTSGVR